MEVEIIRNMGPGKNQIWITIPDINGAGILIFRSETQLQEFIKGIKDYEEK